MTNNDEMALKADWRDDFEKIFSIPAGVVRNPPRKDGGIAGYINQSCFFELAVIYINRWDGYKAAREALLAERDAKDARIAELERQREDETIRANRERHNGFTMATKHMKQHENVHYADAAEMEIAALHERIAELEALATDYGMKFQRAQDDLKKMALMHRDEARTVSVKLPKEDVRDASDFSWGAEVVPLDVVKEACAAAGIKLEQGE